MLIKKEFVERTNVTSVICRGFNNYFPIPSIGESKRAKFRTAVVLKKVDWLDPWGMYAPVFSRVVQNVSDTLAAAIQIDCPDVPSGFVGSFSELRDVEARLMTKDHEYQPIAPSEIRFFCDGEIVCRMDLEDWSDVGKIEPYALSYTYSFYSFDIKVDADVARVVRQQLESESCISEVVVFKEIDRPKWYWPLLTALRRLR